MADLTLIAISTNAIKVYGNDFYFHFPKKYLRLENHEGCMCK